MKSIRTNISTLPQLVELIPRRRSFDLCPGTRKHKTLGWILWFTLYSRKGFLPAFIIVASQIFEEASYHDDCHFT
jgi:hypothetical protein